MYLLSVIVFAEIEMVSISEKSVIVIAEIEVVSISKKIAAIEDLYLCGL